MLAIVTGWIFIALGALLAAGGIKLAALGGSWAYIFLGGGLLLSGVLLARRSDRALALYAGLLLATLIWALWEVGPDRWALIPRGATLALFGVWLLTPWINRDLVIPGHSINSSSRPGWRGPRGLLGGMMLVLVLTTLLSVLVDPFGENGELPRAQASASAATADRPADDWLAYGGTGYGQRYSALSEITPGNIDRLEVAWVFHTGDMAGPDDPEETTFEVTPLKVGDTLYLCTPHSRVIALDAATGAERWRFDPNVQVDRSSQHLTCRGVAYADLAESPTATSTPACQRRIFLPTIDARLFALDAATGEPCADFGEQGVLRLDVRMPNLSPGYYMLTSPPVIAGGLVITGAAINDNVSVDNPSGVIRAFDARSGELVWNWDSGNPDATAPLTEGRQYTAGGPNSWSISSVDEQLGLVYIPMGNQPPDQIGIRRSAETERFSSAIVALEVATGRLRWVFQTVHHDLWDRDVPSQPTLIDLTVDGEPVPALVAPTKQGGLYVLDRRSGEPVLPVAEVPAPRGAIPGDYTAPTQPVSALNLTPQPLRGRDMWGATLWDQLLCRIEFHSMRYDGPYTPPSTQRTLVYPGNSGVFNWGGLAVDPVREIVIGAPSFLAFTFQLIPRDDPQANLVSDGIGPFNENYGGDYAIDIRPFLSPLGLPCQQPPWGAIAGADLRTGEVMWLHRNGTVRDQMPKFLPIPFPMGAASLGGPLITAGGVMFYSGTLDNYLRAYDVTTGRQLWQSRLPAGGQATPMTYRVGGRQMVVVAAGGHGSFGTTAGDAVVAYALSESPQPGD